MPAVSAAADPRHVLFRAGGERFALPLEAVREVVSPQPPFARVPRTSEAVRGAMNLRGRVVVVVDLAPLVGLPPQALAPDQGQVVVLDRDRRALGLLIEGVLGVEALGPPERGGAGAVARGVVSAGGNAVTVLDPDVLAAQSLSLFGGR
ncbi:MAG TPA: chemotaxis protein CheW [Anaeromyxobacteraceae bacterium]|nr:chemotaxis protein CheW [Anaeromyxobacteraceae bacterium]